MPLTSMQTDILLIDITARHNLINCPQLRLPTMLSCQKLATFSLINWIDDFALIQLAFPCPPTTSAFQPAL